MISRDLYIVKCIVPGVLVDITGTVVFCIVPRIPVVFRKLRTSKTSKSNLASGFHTLTACGDVESSYLNFSGCFDSM